MSEFNCLTDAKRGSKLFLKHVVFRPEFRCLKHDITDEKFRSKLDVFICKKILVKLKVY